MGTSGEEAPYELPHLVTYLDVCLFTFHPVGKTLHMAWEYKVSSPTINKQVISSDKCS